MLSVLKVVGACVLLILGVLTIVRGNALARQGGRNTPDVNGAPAWLILVEGAGIVLLGLSLALDGIWNYLVLLVLPIAALTLTSRLTAIRNRRGHPPDGRPGA
jgi:hypothetical protein